MGASVAAAVIAAKEREVAERFREAGATSPMLARTIQDVGVRSNVAFRRLRRYEAIREASPGLFYLDEPVWIAVRRTRRRLALAVMAIVLVMGVGTALGLLRWR